MLRSLLKKSLLILSISAISLTYGYSQEHHAEATHEAADAKHEEHGDEKFNIGDMIMHHVLDEHSWGLTHDFAIPLPIIIYDNGLKVFSSARFAENGGVYDGYKLEHNHILKLDAAGQPDHHASIIDLSITKVVAQLFLSAILMLIIFNAVAKGFKNNKGKAPKGLQSALEPIITFVRDEVVKPNIGPKYEKFLPYMLSVFFFIFINNLLGLIPGSANLTGNIAVTLVLSILTFIITHVNAKSGYWKHIFMPPGVPVALYPIIVPVEIIGMFTKPAALMIRLFANITAGHIVLLSLLGLIFIFKSWAVAPVSVAFTLAMNCLELLVAFLQAFIFTLLSSMYIGSAVAEHDHHDDHH